MKGARRRSSATPQPTCRQWPASALTAPMADPLEISTASRLRRKLAAAEPDRRLVLNVSGVGYRLADPDGVR